MGGGEPLSQFTMTNLASELAKQNNAESFIVYKDEKAVALANCFYGFSTFACRPLLNIHDLVVHPDFRGQGISKKLMQAVKERAVEKGCCKLTLEVLSNNLTAKAAYEAFGFTLYELDAAAGTAQFMEMKL